MAVKKTAKSSPKSSKKSSKDAPALPRRICGHPELRPTRFGEEKPAPCPIVYHCQCGQNWGCPVCGFGAGAWPCACMRERMAEEQKAGRNPYGNNPPPQPSPGINLPQIVKDAIAQVKELEELGVEKKGYGIESPYGPRRRPLRGIAENANRHNSRPSNSVLDNSAGGNVSPYNDLLWGER